MSAPVWRRPFGFAVDFLIAAILIWTLMLVGVLPNEALSRDVGWFWVDWLIKIWLDSPSALGLPFVALSATTTLTLTFLKRFDAGFSAWVPGLHVVDADRDRPGTLRTILRFLGQLPCFGSLGLGLLWALVSRHQRTWADITLRTCTVQDTNRVIP